MSEQSFAVRAMPPLGMSRRYRAGRPWGKETTVVKVVESPKPTQVMKGRDGKEIVIFSDEISPKDLEALKADPHFSVSAVGEHDVDASEVNAIKAKAIEMEAALVEARKDLQGAVEDSKQFRVMSAKQAEESAGLIAKLQQELTDAKAQLQKRGNKNQ